MPNPIRLEEFLELPVEEVADRVRAGGVRVCVFPFNGTRRWFLLEHGKNIQGDAVNAYNDRTGERYIDMYQMLFAHGLETVLAPVFGGDILDRGQEYMDAIGSAMVRLAEHPDFLAFYRNHEVRVHFYGEYRKKFQNGPYAYIIDAFDKVTRETSHNGKHRLFYGVFANDATEAVAEYSIQTYQRYSRPPTRREIIEHYYGEFIEKADIFVGFERFSVFDYPLLNLGDESLYFTAAPSLFMSGAQFRHILYDHLYLRPVAEPDYRTMSGSDLAAMKEYYELHRQITYGVGELRSGIWYAKS